MLSALATVKFILDLILKSEQPTKRVELKVSNNCEVDYRKVKIMSANLDKVLSEIQMLPVNELEKVRRKIDELIVAQEPTPEQKLRQMLFEDGLLSEIKEPNRDVEAFRKHKPITVTGKPVSETIIEERG